MYLTYDEYLDMGGALDETAFTDLEYEAESIINWYTFNRLENESDIPEKVKKCMYRILSLLNDKQESMIIGKRTDDGSVQANISSESNDGVSTSYNTLSAEEAVETFDNAVKATINMYLQGARNSLGRKLLYRGVYPDE